MTDWPQGVGREIHDELDSTNAEGLRRAASGAGGPCWILARNQTAARGRRGRPWVMPPGNFAASLLMWPQVPPADAALRSFVAALALYDALLEVTGRPETLALKWPNDVLLTGGKCAGILLETGGASMALAVGIGVNLAEAPPPDQVEPGATPPISLRAATGASIGPEAFLDLLAPAFARWEGALAAGGFAPVRAAWLARAARLGAPIVARLPGREIAGRFETIDDSGALVLDTPKGLITLPAAEVHFATATDVPESADAARH